MSARLLEVAELNTILDQFGDKHPLPANSSKTIRFTREEKLSVASTPTQLTEGVPPDASAITINQFEAITEQLAKFRHAALKFTLITWNANVIN
jgi:N4-gp56 family major capsid protein